MAKPLISPDAARIDACVEVLCQKGCRAVWGAIDAMEQGEPLPETAHLEAIEHWAVLDELKNVMAVYGRSCAPK
ncbi:hypothetical protein [Thiohalomonas denitrificans]|uniref:Uncharacterized protein n=1 Tax=Thiohalomonas denitrificans TaxID=415747 RepID=A0A1G5R0L4_9GAMM|nr:hypothetical protein [Thiohalomonas denitrificans]SCZ67506.1 hypothetical protein SAMN03097708_03151 [Thiohalomonas denitrificans]